MQKIALVAVLSLASSMAFADSSMIMGRVAEKHLPEMQIQLQANEPSPFEILKKEFDLAKDELKSSDVDDFSTLTDRTGKHSCVSAMNDYQKPNESVQLVHAVAVKIVKPEVPLEPAHGPLFPSKPGVPAETAMKDVYGLVNLNTDSDQSFFDQRFDTISDMQKTRSQRTSVFAPFDNGTGNPMSRLTVTVRKDGDSVLFQLQGHLKTGQTVTMYGYCWVSR